MKIETYIKYRQIFEERYLKCVKDGNSFMGFVIIGLLRTGIRNFKLFLFIYSCDRVNVQFSNLVCKLRAHPIYVIKGGKKMYKIKIDTKSASLVDLWSDNYDRLLNYAMNQIR